MTGRLSVAAWPAFRKAGENRYSELFASALIANGADVVEFTPRAMLRRHDVLLVHWPEIALNRRRWVERMLGTASTLVALLVQRARGADVVWVTHNLRPHEDRSPMIRRFFYWALASIVDGLIHPSVESERKVSDVSERLRHRAAIVVPHGAYPALKAAPSVYAEVMQRFGLKKGDAVALYFGQIRAYKGVPDLVRAVRDVAKQDVKCVVVGPCGDAELAQEIVQLSEADSRVACSLVLQDEPTLAALLERADLVVLPFREVLNSGSVMHALSAHRRVLCPFLGAVADLAEIVGPSWMRRIDPPLTAAQLAEALVWATEARPAVPPSLPGATWEQMGHDVLGWLAEGVAARGRARRHGPGEGGIDE